MAVIDDGLYIVVGIVLIVVAWNVYAVVNTTLVPAASLTMIQLALFVLAAGMAVRGVLGMVRGA